MSPTPTPADAVTHQGPLEVIMIRPRHFGFETETAASNAFQHRSDSDSDSCVAAKAVREFDSAVAELRSAGVRALVFEDRDDPECLGAVFPNNWFTAHREGVVVVYPMRCPSRRKERREDLIEHLRDKYKVRNSCKKTMQPFTFTWAPKKS